MQLMHATQNHAKHESCYVMQYSEQRDDNGQMVGEFMLRGAGKDE
jgi:hypothetical protein